MAAMSDEEKKDSGGTTISEETFKRLHALADKLPASMSSKFKEGLVKMEAAGESEEGLDFQGAAEGLLDGGQNIVSGIENDDKAQTVQGVCQVMAVGCMFCAPPPFDVAFSCGFGLVSMIAGGFCKGDASADAPKVSIQDVINDTMQRMITAIEDLDYREQFQELKTKVLENMEKFDAWANLLSMIESKDTLGADGYDELWALSKDLVENASYVCVQSHIDDVPVGDKHNDRVLTLMILFVKLSLSKLMNVIRMRFLVLKHKPAVGKEVADIRMNLMDTAIQQLKDSANGVLGFMAPKNCSLKDIGRVVSLKVHADYGLVRLFLRALGLENADLHTPAKEVIGCFFNDCKWLTFDSAGKSGFSSVSEFTPESLVIVKTDANSGCFSVAVTPITDMVRTVSSEHVAFTYLFSDYNNALSAWQGKYPIVGAFIHSFVAVQCTDGRGNKVNCIVRPDLSTDVQSVWTQRLDAAGHSTVACVPVADDSIDCDFVHWEFYSFADVKLAAQSLGAELKDMNPAMISQGLEMHSHSH